MAKNKQGLKEPRRGALMQRLYCDKCDQFFWIEFRTEKECNDWWNSVSTDCCLKCGSGDNVEIANEEMLIGPFGNAFFYEERRSKDWKPPARRLL